jgi:hypothetical protein
MHARTTSSGLDWDSFNSVSTRPGRLLFPQFPDALDQTRSARGAMRRAWEGIERSCTALRQRRRAVDEISPSVASQIAQAAGVTCQMGGMQYPDTDTAFCAPLWRRGGACSIKARSLLCIFFFFFFCCLSLAGQDRPGPGSLHATVTRLRIMRGAARP